MFKGPNIIKYSNRFTSPFLRTIPHLGSRSHGRLDQAVAQGPFQPRPFYEPVTLQVAVLNPRRWYRSMANKPGSLAFGPNQSCHSSRKHRLCEASVDCCATSNTVLATFFISVVRTFIRAGVICV